MSKEARTHAALLIGLLAAGPAFAGPLPGFVLTAETKHFSFYAQDGRRVDAARAEASLQRVEQLLGQTVAGRSEYYRYGSEQELAAGTGTYAAGVTFPAARQIHSIKECHDHEIVHLVAGQLGNPGAFFQEGLAVALGNQGRWRGKPVNRIAKAGARRRRFPDLVAGFDGLDPEVSYPLAGSFVLRLIETHGIAKVAAFFRACRPGQDRQRAFLQVFGQSLEGEGAAWLASL
jgi:hypothetical protein